MSNRISVRKLRKEALLMAAAMVRDADFTSLFGDNLLEEAFYANNGDEVLDAAQRWAADRIERLAGKGR